MASQTAPETYQGNVLREHRLACTYHSLQHYKLSQDLRTCSCNLQSLINCHPSFQKLPFTTYFGKIVYFKVARELLNVHGKIIMWYQCRNLPLRNEKIITMTGFVWFWDTSSRYYAVIDANLSNFLLFS